MSRETRSRPRRPPSTGSWAPPAGATPSPLRRTSASSRPRRPTQRSSTCMSRSPQRSRTSVQARLRQAAVSPDRHDDPAPAPTDTAAETVNPGLAGQERIDALFVQSATGLTSDGRATVTLHGLAESTVYFADRPRREVGHMRTRSFIELWAEGSYSFAVDPPNAVLSFLDDGDASNDVVVVLHDPRLAGDSLTYQVEVLEGTLPESTGPCALFIDSFGRGLSPVSVPQTG